VRNPFEGVFTAARLNSLTKWASLKQYALSAAIQPGAIEFKRLAGQHGLKTPDRILGVGLTGMLDSSAIRSMMESLAPGTSELMCHPGMYDDDLDRAHTRLKRQREKELAALSDSNLRRFAEEQGVELINYRGL
jgi:predicted glycoside hydrolase/deacetylase ChbG (UPF0249 family)